MIQLWGTLTELLVGIPYIFAKEGTKQLIKRAPEITRYLTNYFVNKKINELNKKFTSSKGSGITLANNEIKDIIKVIKSLENRGILSKETTRKSTSQEKKFLNFLRLLMTSRLSVMKSMLTPLGKSVLLPFRLSAKMPAADAAI